MEQLLQQINMNTAIWIIVGCGLLCVVGVVFSFAFQFLGMGLGIIFNILEFLGSIVTGGPAAWCGCLVAIFGCAACGGFYWIISVIIPNCGTPQALNICRFLGY